jgi:hypothetical protein
MLYVFGKRDPLKNLIDKAIVEEGDYTVINHSSGHNIPRLTGDNLRKFSDFISKVSENSFGEKITFEEEMFDTSIKDKFLSETKGHGYLSKL